MSNTDAEQELKVSILLSAPSLILKVTDIL